MSGNELINGYVIGLIDAEASFSVSVKLQKDLVYGIRLDPVFSITQLEEQTLKIVKNVIGAGRIIKKPGQEHLYVLIIDNMKELNEQLIPFIDKYIELLHSKRRQYEIFREIVSALYRGEHKDPLKLRELILKVYELSNLSRKSRRKRALREVLEIIESRIAKRWGLPGER